MRKNALIIIDAQNDFVTGVLGTPEAQKAVPKIVELLKRANEHSDRVIFTQDYHTDEKYYLQTQEGRRLPIPHCLAGTKGVCILSELTNEISNTGTTEVRTKTQFGYPGWSNISFQDLWDYDKITICGFCTDICVIVNALLLKTEFPRVNIEVVADACAGTTPEMHQKALDVMKSCQIDIV